MVRNLYFTSSGKSHGKIVDHSAFSIDIQEAKYCNINRNKILPPGHQTSLTAFNI